MSIYLGSQAIRLYAVPKESVNQYLVDENTNLINDVNLIVFKGGDDATATASDIFEGYKGWSNHELITGTLPKNQVYEMVTIDGKEVNRVMNLISNCREISTLPYQFYFGGAVVYNNEIHILGSSNSGGTYKYN